MSNADDTPATPTTATTQSDDRWTWQFWVTIGLLVGFGVLIVVLMLAADDATEIQWSRRVYLLTGVEAIVFTSVGWLFGREVNRGTVENAKETAKAATEAASTAQQQVEQKTAEVVEARTEAARMGAEVTAEQAKGAAVRAFTGQLGVAAPPPQDGAREVGLGGERSAPPAASADALRALVDELWPPT